MHSLLCFLLFLYICVVCYTLYSVNVYSIKKKGNNCERRFLVIVIIIIVIIIIVIFKYNWPVKALFLHESCIWICVITVVKETNYISAW